jgi:hypothetical protein
VYETIEKMTPVQQILYQEENEDQKQSETNLHQQQQLIQLKASFQISKVNLIIIFKRISNIFIQLD